MKVSRAGYRSHVSLLFVHPSGVDDCIFSYHKKIRVHFAIGHLYINPLRTLRKCHLQQKEGERVTQREPIG